MVVDDDDVAGKLGGAGERLVARRAAVDGHDEARALLDEAFDGGGVGPVAFEQTVGNVDARLEPVMGKVAGEQRRRRRAVDVVVAEQCHRLARLDRVRDALCRSIHVAQARGVRHQRLERGAQDVLNVVGRDPARCEHAAQQLRQAVALADDAGERLRLGAQTLAPDEAARGRRDAEKRRRLGRGIDRFAQSAHGRLPRIKSLIK